MAVIDANGLFGGDRIARLSDRAILHWPFFFLASNGFGRIEVNYAQLMAVPLRQFKSPPSQQDVAAMFREYHENHLAFLYRAESDAGTTIWAQWWAKEGSLKVYKTAEDRRSPAPPEKAFEEWMDSYRSRKASSTMALMLGADLPMAIAPVVESGQAKKPASPMVEAVLEHCSEQWPTIDEKLAQRIVAAGIEAFPDWSVDQVGPALRKATKRNQEGPALYLTTIPPVLRMWKKNKAATAVVAPIEIPEPSNIDQATIDAWDQEQLKKRMKASSKG